MFNPLMALIVAYVSQHLKDDATVIELGNQTFSVNGEALKAIAHRLQGAARVNADALASLTEPSERSLNVTTADFYRILGFSDYKAIDVNDKFGSLIMDLNKDLHESYDYQDTFSLVTNNGTGEHIFDQATVFRNMHNLTHIDGFMVHVLPWSGINLLNHGFFRFEPGLYFDLAEANQYSLFTVGISDRWGYGIEAILPQSTSDPKGGDAGILLTSKRIHLASFKSIPDCKYGRIRDLIRRAKHNLRYRLRFLGRDQKPSRLQQLEITRALHCIAKPTSDLLVFAVLQKCTDRPFRVPFQNKYTDAIKGEGILLDYAGQTKVS